MTDTARTGQCQDSLTDEIPGETLSLGNFFSAATPPLNSTVDDARVARAEWWLINDCPDAGADAFASAVEAAAVLRDSYHLSSSLAEAQLNDLWNRVACEPPLMPSQIAEAVRQAYCFRPAIAGAPTAVAPPQPDGRAIPAPPEWAAQPPPIEVGRQRRRPLSGRERMARRRAELRRLGLPGETKGRLKALKVTATAEIVTTTGTPTAEIVTAGAEIVTPNATEVVQ